MVHLCVKCSATQGTFIYRIKGSYHRLHGGQKEDMTKAKFHNTGVQSDDPEEFLHGLALQCGMSKLRSHQNKTVGGYNPANPVIHNLMPADHKARSGTANLCFCL
jgi:hypothetical protein